MARPGLSLVCAITASVLLAACEVPDPATPRRVPGPVGDAGTPLPVDDSPDHDDDVADDPELDEDDDD